MGNTKIFILKNDEVGDYLLEKTKIIQGCPVQTRDQNHTKAASIN